MVQPAFGGGRGDVFVAAIDYSAGCSLALASKSRTLTAKRGSVSVKVKATAGCPWTAASSASWITLDSASGVGDGVAAFTVSANGAEARSSIVTIAGQRFTVRQQRAR